MTDPTIPLPDPVPLPAPGWLLWSLLQLTFVLHVVAMNLVLGGSILSLIVWLRRDASAHARTLVASHTRWLPVVVAATISLGVAPLLFSQVLYGRLLLTSSILLGWTWLAVIPLVIVAYYGAYLLAIKGTALGAWETPARLASVVVWITIAWIYANNMTLMLRPETFRTLHFADPTGPRLAIADASLIPRYLHVVLGAVAVAGLAAALAGLAQRHRDAEFATWTMRFGSLVFGVATAVNMAVGTWYFVALPREAVLRFMGGSGAATIWLSTGILLGMVALGAALASRYARDPAPMIKVSGGALAATLISMVLSRDQVRQAALETAGYRLPAWVVPQWGPIALFVLLLVAALATVAWMVVALARGTREA
jgi:hypothetical protein